jgi:hypothetical protein
MAIDVGHGQLAAELAAIRASPCLKVSMRAALPPLISPIHPI